MPPDLHSIRGIFFDLWNTLAYSRFTPNPMVMIAEGLGIAARPDWRKILERGMMTRPFLGIREAIAALEREAGASAASPGDRERLIRAWNEASAATEIYDDVIPALDALRPRYRLGILSNTQSFDLDFLRGRELAARMDVLCLSYAEGRLKPDPLLFATAAGRIGLPPAGILMVGDSAEDDVAGAVRAGMRALHLVRQGVAPPVDGASGVLDRLTGLPSLLSSGPAARA